MTTKKNPTNADIYQLLGQLKEEVKEVKLQTQRTNGRVTTIEQWKNGLEAVEAYKERNPQPTAQEKEEGWSVREKFLVGLISSLVAIIIALIGAGKVLG